MEEREQTTVPTDSRSAPIEDSTQSPIGRHPERIEGRRPTTNFRTKLPPVEVTLNVWASARWHTAMGGAGHPVYEEILKDPMPVPPSQQIADRSDLTYDATRGKYLKRAKETDVRVTSAIEQVERALKECEAPDWLRRYLLFKYPTTGRYGPAKRLAKNADPDYDPARAFIDSGHWRDFLGTIDSPQLRRNSCKTLKSVERQLKSTIR